MTADDVVFSYGKAANAATSAFAADYAQFQTVAAVDPYTVKITLKQPVPSLLGLVANYSGGFILSKKAYTERGDGFKRAPIGTGPFMFKSVAPANRWSWWPTTPIPRQAEDHRDQLPLHALRRLAGPGIRERRDRSRRRNPGSEMGSPDEGGPARGYRRDGTRRELSQIYLNITSKPLDDIRVRQAIAYGINRAEILRWRGADVAREPRSVIPSGYLGFTADNGLLPYDPAKAKQLLADAGYKDGVTVKMVMTQEPNSLALMQVVQAQLKRVGITIDMNVVEHATYHQMIRQDLSRCRSTPPRVSRWRTSTSLSSSPRAASCLVRPR